ncbi:hypothetical protein ACF3MZ_10785 [Paenibacillaceae bacterium WGS1546]|uniref:hypothetical protein n=1 Tax=Cohnella sp. WGS1546 TaxID=3366810 RepID=UPI00372D7E02
MIEPKSRQAAGLMAFDFVNAVNCFVEVQLDAGIGHGGYVLPDEVPELNYVNYLDGLQGDGMVNSTAGDLLRLNRALYNDKFVSPMLRQLMFSPVKMNNGETFHYGMGWLIEHDDRLGSILHHSGGCPGY